RWSLLDREDRQVQTRLIDYLRLREWIRRSEVIESGVEAVQEIAAAQSRSDHRFFRELVSKSQAGSEVVVAGAHIRILRDVSQAGENQVARFKIEIDVATWFSR